jgi:RNA polymerase primary sigma factor
MDLDSDDVRFALRASRRPLSLEKPVGEEEESELGDFVPDELLTTPTDMVEQAQLSDQVEQVLETLTPREAQILRLRFGLQGGRAHTLKEVGKILGLTRERVRQIEKQALRRLQYPSRARLLRDFL